MRLTAALIIVLSGVAPVFAAAPGTEAVRVTASGLGRSLTEAMWKTVPAVKGFVEREPQEGAEPAQATEFRVAYDDTTLYVQVRAYDTEPDKIVTYLTRRDDESPCDWIRILVDSYHDRRTAYEFAVNPDGVKQDRYWFNDTNNDISWDAVWDVTVSRDESGWLAEFRIPFSQLRFTPSATNTFGFAIARDVGRLKATSTWPLLARSANGYVSSFGELSGVATGRAVKRLELTPYTVASLTRQQASGNPLVDSSSAGSSVGLDMKYALTPGLTLTATINPDFGQVEADPATVNLSAFETFFAERRPFFVEGSGNFRFDADCYDGCNNLFYSRRVGRAPHGTGTVLTGYSDAPLQTTILGAAKLTGRVGRYSVGVVHAVTQEEFADVLYQGVSSRLAVEPPSNYSVARVRREFPNQSYIGAIGTAVNRGAERLNYLPDHAFAGGADFDWRMGKRYSMNGFFEGSRVSGTEGAMALIQTDSRHLFQRPDLVSSTLDVTRTSLNGYAGALAFNKIGGEFVRSNSYFYARSPGFETNDLGFLRRADFRRQGNWLQLRNNRPSRWFRNRTINFNQWTAWNYDGDRLFGGFNVNGNLTWRSNWAAGGGFNWNAGGFDDRASRGGPGALSNRTREAWAWLNSDNRRTVAANLSVDVGGDAQGSSWAGFDPEVIVRPVPAVLFSIGTRINHNVADSQWVNNLVDIAEASRHYVFGRLDQTTVSLTGRLNYTMSPTLSLQLYAEPFVSGGDYRAFRELVDGRNPDYTSRYTPFDYSYAANGNPDFNVKSFRTTNVLRWEYRPGSTLFVVWQQAREEYASLGGFRFGRDARAIFGVPPHNVFLVKLAYWLNT